MTGLLERTVLAPALPQRPPGTWAWRPLRTPWVGGRKERARARAGEKARDRKRKMQGETEKERDGEREISVLIGKRFKWFNHVHAHMGLCSGCGQ